MNTNESDYEHAGEWDCEGCGETFEVETKLDPLLHAFECGDDPAPTHDGGHEGYRRRRQELERAAEGSA